MMGELACEGIVMQSMRSKIEQMARMFSFSGLWIEGVLRRMLIPSDAETAEKTKEVPLICW